MVNRIAVLLLLSLPLVSSTVFAQAGGPIVGPPVVPQPGPALGQLPPQPVQVRLTAPEPPLGADAAKLPQALDDAIAGKLSLDDVEVYCRSEDSDFVLYGPRFGFVKSTQIKPGKDVLLAVLKRVQKAGFAAMPESLGGNPNPNLRGPVARPPVQLLRQFTVTIGSASKSVTQMGEGEQSAELLDMIGDLEKELAPLAAKGLKLDSLSLKDGLALLAKGELAPEALAISFACTSKKDLDHPQIMVIQAAHVRLFISRAKLSRADAEAMIKRLAKVLADTDLVAFPRQLYWPDALIGVDLRLQGIASNLNVSGDTGPYNQGQAKAHPEAQKAFDQMVAELRRVYSECSTSQPDGSPGKSD
ncbi:MAG: hypothetical protein PHU85_17830 [Phycisphaerae bacterium]|nr:hypothetical protein [Phycisphaerae bacterium]